MKKPLRGSPSEGDLCYYCGVQATDVEHAVPLSMMEGIALATVNMSEEIVGRRTLKVFSCSECNLLLSNSWQETLSHRKRELKRRLKKRYSKLLKMPDWTDEELDSFGYVLKSDIQGKIIKRNSVRDRLKW